MQHVGYGQTLVLAEVEYLDELGITILVEHRVTVTILQLTPDDTACEVNVLVHLRDVGQLVHIVLEHLLGILAKTRKSPLTRTFRWLSPSR